MITRWRKMNVISVQEVGNDELISMIEKMEGVSVKRTLSGIKIRIQERSASKSSMGIVIRKRNKKGRKVEHLTTIHLTESDRGKKCYMGQSSAIIAKCASKN